MSTVAVAPTDTDAPTTEAIADTLGVAPDRLEAFVEALEEPTAAAVLGWATVEPGAVDDVEAWLASRDSEEEANL